MKHEFINKENGKIASVLVMYLDDEGHMQMNSYDKVEDLLADYGAYERAADACIKHYRLVKDLPTFKAGQEFELGERGLYLLNQTEDGTRYEVMAYHKDTLERFPNILKDWFEPIEKSECKSENYELGHFKIKRPKNAEAILRDMKEPLIKDEKIRRAVRAWAEANGYNNETNLVCYTDYQSTWFKTVDNRENEIHFNGQQSGVEDGQMYPIEELCGEEE